MKFLKDRFLNTICEYIVIVLKYGKGTFIQISPFLCSVRVYFDWKQAHISPRFVPHVLPIATT
jgi:hypothetical protein